MQSWTDGAALREPRNSTVFRAPAVAEGEDGMLTLAPLPAWSNLIGALRPGARGSKELASVWHRDGEVAGWLSRSAWSLALIAQWRKLRHQGRDTRVWIPDFFCNGALLPLRHTGVKLVFYPVDENIAPDEKACRILADTDPPDVFLLVHYFGRPRPSGTAIEICAGAGAWLVEDAAHVLRPIEAVGCDGDFVLYSPHKLLPVPDGAVLVVRSTGPSRLNTSEIRTFGSPESWPGSLAELTSRLGIQTGNGRRLAGIWLFKRMLQKLGIRRPGRSTTPFAEALESTDADRLSFGVPEASKLTFRLLPALLEDMGDIERQRKLNLRLWRRLVIGTKLSTGADLSGIEWSDDPSWIPYMADFNVESGAAPDLMRAWQEMGLPVVTWPDLPPEVKIQREHHRMAWSLRHSRLYLSTHQSLRISEWKP